LCWWGVERHSLGLCEQSSQHALRVMCFAHKAQPQNY